MKKNKTVAMLGALLAFTVAMGPVNEVSGALNVPVSVPVTVEATVTGSNNLSVAVKNSSDDQTATKVAFANASAIAKASQYLQIDFNSNSIGARVVLRTDNKNSSKPYTGTDEGAGLVGNTDSKFTAPLLWAVFDDVTPAKSFAFTGDTDPSSASKGTVVGATERGNGEAEGLVVDKNNKSTGGYEGASVQGYATVVVPNGTTGSLGGFPSDADGAADGNGNGNPGDDGLRSCTSPVFVVLAGAFNGLPAQAYTTNTLALDLVVQ